MVTKNMVSSENTFPKKRRLSESRENGSCHKIYLDYNATTPLALEVAQTITSTLTECWGNPSSSHESGGKAKSIILDARANLLKMVHGNTDSEIIFMSGGTEANNNIIHLAIEYFNDQKIALGIYAAKSKPHIITSNIEHDSILNALKYYEKKGLIDVTYLGISLTRGQISPDDIVKHVKKETVLVTIMLANNETGAIQPIKEITKKLSLLDRSDAMLPKILVHSDAAQAIGKIPVDVQSLGLDYLTIVGHKFYGPRIGALWVHKDAPFYPMMHGGGQEKGRRSGTENTCMIAGLGEAARLVAKNILDYENHFNELRKYLIQKLKEVFGEENVKFNMTSCDSLPNTLNVSIVSDLFTGHKILSKCKYLEASVGAACHADRSDSPSQILLAQGISFTDARNAIRLSLGRETCKSDIDIVVDDLYKAASSLRVASA